MSDSTAQPKQQGFVQTVKSFPSAFWVANTMEIFERMAWYGFFAVSSLYITGPVETGGLGFTSEERGQLQAIVPFFLYLFPVITGALADRYGYKKMFIIAYTGMILSYYALGQFKTFPTFLGAFMCVAVAAAIFKPVVVGTVARVTNEGNSRLGFGVFYMMVNIGGFVGPLVAGVVRGLSWKYVFISCAAWAAVNLVIVTVFYRDPTTESKSGQKRSLKKVGYDMVEVLGNVRFGITVFVVLIALMVANQELENFHFWPECTIFIIAWLVVNFLMDAALPKGSGNPDNPASHGRPFFLKRMHCSNWRFALFLLIMSGFWTSFNQIFLTMPEYVRDYVDTKPMVDAGKKLFNAVGHPEWINGLAAIEETEAMAEFDDLLRRSRGVAPMLPEEAAPAKSDAESGAAKEDETKKTEATDNWQNEPSLSAEDITALRAIAARINRPEATDPITPKDLVEAAKKMLGYKVRIEAATLGKMIEDVPASISAVDSELLDTAVATVNKRLEARARPLIEGDDVASFKKKLEALMLKSGPVVSAAELKSLAESVQNGDRTIDPEILALSIRDVAYRPTIWERLEAGRQVNPEHIVNIDALSIILLQVFISFMMGRFHQFTTMIVGMIIAAIGIGLPALAGGTMIGPIGGMLIVVIVGIVIFAIGEMMASPTSQEYVGRIAPKDKVALYMGYYFVAVALGNLFGGILSGQLYGKLTRDMQRPDLMWMAFGAIMLGTAIVFVLYNQFALPKSRSDSMTSNA
ncbi:MAG: MFS transporter [Phycisphaerales bacterium]|nr:MFS transporter [Phycisphaerales bacterium]MCB9863546.1 MFS transporter [Phycisphaerales bacterium]